MKPVAPAADDEAQPLETTSGSEANSTEASMSRPGLTLLALEKGDFAAECGAAPGVGAAAVAGTRTWSWEVPRERILRETEGID